MFALKPTTKKSFYWCMYDWANSAFAVCIISGFFPIFFKSYWARDLDSTDSTYWLGIFSSLISAFIFFFSPLLGQISNTTSSKMRNLRVVTLLGVTACLLFVTVGEDQWWWAGVIFIVSSICFNLSHLFYDSLLPEYSQGSDDYHSNSLMGYGLGYLGGGLIFLLQSLVIQKPEIFGIDKVTAVYGAFVTTALWWLFFSAPLLMSKPLHHYNENDDQVDLKAFFQKLKGLILSPTPLSLFLISYFFYIDGVHTVYKMAVDYGLSIGLESSTMILTLLIVQFVGFPAALLFTWLSHRVSKFLILKLGILAYLVVILLATQIHTAAQFIACGVLIGIFQGSVQALSRSYFCELIPSKEETGSYFGLYNMLGKFSALFGPLTTGLVTSLTGSHRIGLTSLSIYLILGLIFFPKDQKKA